MSISPVPEIVAELRAGRMVILVDEEDRENEGDLVLAAQFVTPAAINFMATHGRGLICLSLTEARCRQLNLPPMVRDNRSPLGTNFTVSIEAASGVTTGIAAHDRARTVQAAVAPNAKPEDIVQPGHIFPLMAQAGGVLVRAGHTEAGCDLAALGGLEPAAVICEILNEDGSMARLPDLERFAQKHGLLIGTIADLIHFRSRTETLVRRVTEQTITTAHGEFRLVVYLERLASATHIALVRGQPNPEREVFVRVHEPLSVLDLLDRSRNSHSWSVDEALAFVAERGEGVIVLLNCQQSSGELIERVGTHRRASGTAAGMDLLTHGIGAQILRDLGVAHMRLLATPRKMPSMAGWGLEVLGFVSPEREAHA